MNDDANEINDGNYRTTNNKTTISRSFECKTKIIESTVANNNTRGIEVV